MAVTHRYAFTMISKTHIDAVYANTGKDDTKRRAQFGQFLNTEQIITRKDSPDKFDTYVAILFERMRLNLPDGTFDANTTSILSFNEYGDERDDTFAALELFKQKAENLKFVPVIKNQNANEPK